MCVPTEPTRGQTQTGVLCCHGLVDLNFEVINNSLPLGSKDHDEVFIHLL